MPPADDTRTCSTPYYAADDILSPADRERLVATWCERANRLPSRLHPHHQCNMAGGFEVLGEPTVEIARNIGDPNLKHVAVRGRVRCRECGHEEAYTHVEEYPLARSDDGLAALASHFRKLDVQPGDVFALELTEEYDLPCGDEAQRINEEFRAACGRQDVRLVIVPPGCKLEKQQPGRPRDASREGVFLCHHAMLATLLGLPPGARVVGTDSTARFLYNELAVKFEHDRLLSTSAGGCLPEVRPLYKADGSFDRWEIVRPEAR